MSATLDLGGLTETLSPAPLVQSEGRQFPLEIHYLPADPHARIYTQVTKAIGKALNAEQGGVLVFLPGAREIRQTEAALKELEWDIRIHPLYGDLPYLQQQAAILTDPGGKFIRTGG